MANSRLGRFLVVALVGLAGTALGCGGDNGGGVSEFLGTWTYNMEQATLTCPGQPDQSVDLGTLKTWREGVKSDLVDVSSICNYRFDIKNHVASIQSGQTCAFDDGAGGTVNEVPSTWTFTLTSAASGDEQFDTVATLAGGTMCSFTGKGKLDRLTKD